MAQVVSKLKSLLARMTIFGEHILTLLLIALAVDVIVNGTKITLVIVTAIMEVPAQEALVLLQVFDAVHVEVAHQDLNVTTLIMV